MDSLRLPSPLHHIHYEGIQLYIKRDDLIHPNISGNKWRKLKYHIQNMKDSGQKGILSFGGAFSNHLHALAAAGNCYDFETIGIVRGEKYRNPTLEDAERWGMELSFISRESYKQKSQPDFLENLQKQYPNYLIVPEGGTSAEAVQGVGELWGEIDIKPDVVIVPVGSGGTLSGVLSTAPKSVRYVAGVLALKNGGYMKDIISTLVAPYETPEWELLEDFHFGGFAKINRELLTFQQAFESQHQIPVDLVYNAKALYALKQLILAGRIKKGDHVLYIHTGGLQGNRGMAEKINRLSTHL